RQAPRRGVGLGGRAEAAQSARVHRPQAALPREDGGERRHPAGELLQRRPGRLRGLRQRLVRELQMIPSRLKTGVFSLALVSLLALLATASTASAGVRLNGVDFGAYPTVGATIVTSAPSAAGPKLLENGRPVVGLQAVNLGRCKNVVLALDTSRSMAGKPLAEAGAAATAFVASKPACDRMALVTFGQRATQQGPFSSSTIDADNALRNLAVGANSGTALWDAVDLSARVL